VSRWQYRPVSFKYQLSDWTLFSISLRLQVRMASPFDEPPPAMTPTPPTDELMEGSQGFLIRGLPIAKALPVVSRTRGYLTYVPLQYQHCYIDLGLTLESYQNAFSSKTRSTIKRKIRKYSQHCGGTIPWRTYKTPEEMREFVRLARAVSKLTYQERLLDAGIPDTEDFIHHAESLAHDDRVRAYILFDGERAVSYLYCPVQDGILIYAYLGYDPDYMQMSVGTILQWLAVEQLFQEARFRYFDFTEGQSDHKRLFATHQLQCANVFFVKRSIRNTTVIYSQLFINRVSRWVGTTLDRWGMRARIRRFLRFTK
jgi:CelD/BcsL family acetyltransferase involved in cellulose biosynthesis